MYQRYIANPDGTFRKTVVDDPPAPAETCAPPQPPSSCPPQPPPPPCAPEPAPFSLRSLLPQSLDVGDLLLVLILLLLLIDSEEDDARSVLFLLAAFVLF